MRPTRRRDLARWFQETFGASVVRACQLAQFSRAALYRPSRARDQGPLRLFIRELTHARPRFGYQRIWVLLRREGWRVNQKRVRRLYRLEGLQVRMRVRRWKHIALHRGPAPVPAGPTERWSMDFVHDALADGRAFRVLTVVDQSTRTVRADHRTRRHGRAPFMIRTGSGLAVFMRAFLTEVSEAGRWQISCPTYTATPPPDQQLFECVTGHVATATARRFAMRRERASFRTKGRPRVSMRKYD